MTNSLQDLIDASIFISTEYQGKLAEVVGNADYDVNFAEQSLTFNTASPVSFQPYLLGTESENRGTWIWSWQQLGYFPDAVVAAAMQARAAGERDSVLELSTDEIPLSEGLARRLTLATKTLTGIYAHYPLPSGSVRAWTLIDSPALTLEAPTYKGVGRVIAKALQSEDIQNQPLAINSYARQRGFHTAWDTEATVVLTMTDGALRLWFDEGRISGIERAQPEVSAQELEQLAAQAAQDRADLEAERLEIEQLAAAEAAEQVALREQQSAERAAARAEAEQGETVTEAQEETVQAEVPAASAQVAGVSTTENLYPDTEAPFDQDPREDSEPGRVTVNTLPGEVVPAPEQPRTIQPGSQPAAAQASTTQASSPAAGTARRVSSAGVSKPAAASATQQGRPAGASGADESTEATAIPVVTPAEAEQTREQQEQEQAQENGKKKGFFSRFFGL